MALTKLTSIDKSVAKKLLAPVDAELAVHTADIETNTNNTTTNTSNIATNTSDITAIEAVDVTQNDRLTTNEASITSLIGSQTGGLISYLTFHELGTAGLQTQDSFKVTNDPSSNLNGYYHWVSGSTYAKDADLVENTIDSNNTSDGVSGAAVVEHTNAVVDQAVSVSTYYLGQENLSTDEGAGGGSNDYIIDSPATEHQILSVFKIGVITTAGATYKVRVYSRSGDVVTVEREQLVTSIIGLNEFKVRLEVKVGEYIGCWLGAGHRFNQSELVGLSFLQGNAANVGDSFTAGKPWHKFNWQIETLLNKLDLSEAELVGVGTKIEELDQSLFNINDSLTNTVHYLGTTRTPTGGIGLGGNDYVINVPATSKLILRKFRHTSVTAANKTYKVRVYSKLGNTFTLKREHVFNTVVGVNEVDVYLPIDIGDCVGCYFNGGYAKYDDEIAPYLPMVSGNLANIGDSFTNDNPSSYRFHWQFLVDESRLDALEEGNVLSSGLPFDYNLILGVGQSLMAGGSTNVQQTTVQEYDTLGWPWEYSNDYGPLLYPATADSTGLGSQGSEWPGLGCAAYLKELLARNTGIATDIKGNTVVINNGGVGGANIDEISKGHAIGSFGKQVDKAANLHTLTNSNNSGVLGLIFMQGETENETFEEYITKLATLANDYNVDLKAATGQSLDINMFSYQCSTRRTAALKHITASNRYSNIILAAPMYQLTYVDGLHIDGPSTRLIGAYFAKAIYETQVSGLYFEPLKPIDLRVMGNSITITFNRSGLILDETLVPLQTDYGFSVKAGNNSKTITSVVVKNFNQVKITLDEPPQEGWIVGYGNDVVNKPPQAGVCGNLRDNDGVLNVFDNYPLHNWSVVFDLEI